MGAMAPGQWNFAHNLGPTQCHFDGAAYVAAAAASRHKFARVNFTDCDFQGFFDSPIQVAFDTCTFVGCDFGLTTWTNVKFANCTFTRCSFGMTVLNNCEFRGCDWAEIGISPNMLQLNETYISNPSEFIAAAYTTTDLTILAAHNADLNTQLTKLEETKATIARRILRNLQEEGDEAAFYDAVKTFQLQQVKARQRRAWYEARHANSQLDQIAAELRHAVWASESVLLKIIGKLNDWGASITRPIIATAILTLVFAAVYHWICNVTVANGASLQRSFNITLLAGYGNYNAEKDLLTIIVQNVHLVLATLLYAITFTTIVARLSRVR